jgi:AraC-like DNA-binding protein
LDPTIGYGFFRPDISGTVPLDVDKADEWSELESTTLGILGTSPLCEVIARMAGQRLGAEVVYRHPAPLAEMELAIRSQSFGKVMAARILGVVLPWPEDLLTQVQQHPSTPVNPDIVLVVWRRSLAIERALVHIGQHYLEPVQLCTLAKVACISKFRLVRLFTATLGITPHRYQLLLRVSHAKALLRDGARITQIAHRVGFADHSHLNRSFRLLIGMTPTQYLQTVGTMNGAISF